MTQTRQQKKKNPTDNETNLEDIDHSNTNIEDSSVNTENETTSWRELFPISLSEGPNNLQNRLPVTQAGRSLVSAPALTLTKTGDCQSSGSNTIVEFDIIDEY